jgi:hypothetical protein
VNSVPRPSYTTPGDERVSDACGEPAVDPLAESIIHVRLLIADRPRAIDRYIDYFGDSRQQSGPPRVTSDRDRRRQET